MVIIISGPDDGHVPYVTKHLQEPYLVLDAGTILEGNGLSYHLDKTGVQIYVAGQRLRNITGVWLRRPRRLKDITIGTEARFER
jgi:hypothetical protein